ncbi:MAG: adenylate/guanylate cyclase domain-containing protein [Kiritimatiellae bacterium]|nr:adenylate/guanylate cyclase domain-containing protein [Kiritimatiellia bacterium]
MGWRRIFSRRVLRHIPLVWTIGSVITLLCLVIFVLGLDVVDAVSDKLYDALLRQVHEQPKSGRVAIVDLDEKSLEELGQWPWPRYLTARLTERILSGSPSVVAYDVVFAEPDRTSPEQLRIDLQRNLNLLVEVKGLPADMTDYDRLLAQALSGGKTILGCFMHASPTMVAEAPDDSDPLYDGSRLFLRGTAGVNINEYLTQAKDITVPIPILRKSAETAFFNASVDADNVVRKNPLIWAFGPQRIYPSLALEAVRLDRGLSQSMIEYDDGGVVQLRLRDVLIPCTKSGRLVVNYRTVHENPRTGLASSFPSYSAADLLDGTVDSSVLSNKIVFVGTSAIGLRDLRATPLARLFPGVEVHATMVDNILAGDALSEPNWMDGAQFMAILVVGLFMTFLISRGCSWLSFLLTLLTLGLSMATAVVLLAHRQMVFVPAWTMLSTLLIYPVLTMIRFWQEEQQKQRVRNMFGTMVSRDVLRYLEANPESFSLRGERTEATVFFSDVAGFTTISEQMEPDRMTDLLNRYLTPMTDIILGHGGYVDKYEGDAVMAEWGVPFRADDHAAQACLAAIEQQERLAQLRPELKKEFGHELHVRMGINTGTVTAGNMGSDMRFSYTVMGDTVNFASRLEPTNKEYGTSILIGEATAKAAADVIEVRFLDKIVVQGKSKPVTVYELLGKRGTISDDTRKVASLYTEALHLHWERRWEDALDTLAEALGIDPDDGPSNTLRIRITGYRDDPPPEDWGGEYVRTTKD